MSGDFEFEDNATAEKLSDLGRKFKALSNTRSKALGKDALVKLLKVRVKKGLFPEDLEANFVFVSRLCSTLLPLMHGCHTDPLTVKHGTFMHPVHSHTDPVVQTMLRSKPGLHWRLQRRVTTRSARHQSPSRQLCLRSLWWTITTRYWQHWGHRWSGMCVLVNIWRDLTNPFWELGHRMSRAWWLPA